MDNPYVYYKNKHMDNYLNTINGNIIVEFNGKQFNTNIYLMNIVSKFFQVIHKGQFKEKDLVSISFNSLLNTPLDPSFFEQFIKCCYTDNFSLTMFKTLVDVVEYYRLLDYLQFVSIDKYEFHEYVCGVLDNIEAVDNTYDRVMKECREALGKKYDNAGGDHYSMKIIKYKKHGGFDGWNDLPKPSHHNIGLDLFPLDATITHEYTQFLLKFCNRSYHTKIVGISNIDISRIKEFDESFHKYIFNILAFR